MRFRRGLAGSVVLLALLLAGAAGAQKKGVVNINTAGQEQLTLLPRVGPALARRILDFRDANGKFAASEDLMLVRGIGEKVFALLEPYVALEGETTLREKVKSPARGTNED